MSENNLNLEISTSDVQVDITIPEHSLVLEFNIETSQPTIELEVGGPGGLDTEQVNEAIEKYLDDNPYTINDVPPDENKNFELNTLTDVELAELSARIT